MKRDRVLVLYDEDEEYAGLMGEYLLGCRNLPWKIAVCTSGEDLKKTCEMRSPEMLVVAGSCYGKKAELTGAVQTVILNDHPGGISEELSGEDGKGVLQRVEKYQAADETLRHLLELYAGKACDDDSASPGTDKEKAKLIGVFSPVRRCYQTTFSVLMGRILSARSRVLYLSFEFCEGCEELISRDGARNLSDLMYFIKSPPSVFSIRFRSMVRTISGLDYIPAALSGTDLSEIPEEEWRIFLNRICQAEGYSYVILDLSESIRGIFGILRMCDRIYTLTRHDKVAKRKIENYEFVLGMYEYSDVRDKSIKCCPPYVGRVPLFSDDLVSGELVNYIRDQIGAL